MEAAGNYHSGDDYIVEFLGHRFSFSAADFEERVTAAAVRLGLVPSAELDEDETADLVELVERDAIGEPRSALGEYLIERWDALALVRGESLVYWLKKLVFRGAWLDHRVKEGLLEVDWDDESKDFTYADTDGGRALVELLPTPSWHELQYKRLLPSVGSTELGTGVGSTEPATSGGAGFAGAGAGRARRCRLCRRREREHCRAGTRSHFRRTLPRCSQWTRRSVSASRSGSEFSRSPCSPRRSSHSRRSRAPRRSASSCSRRSEK